MSLTTMFFPQIDFKLHKISNESIDSAYFHRGIEIVDLNGKKLVLRMSQNNHAKLTKLICFLNLDGPRKIFKRDNFGKANLIDITSLKNKKHEEKMEYSHIEICLKFENPGNYFIILMKDFTVGWIQFYVKIKKANEERCVFKLFKKFSELEKNVLKRLRHCIRIKISKTDVDDIEDEQMNVYIGNLFNNHAETKFVAVTYPLFIDGSYEFYLDEDGITKERVKIVEPNH
ncbi:unnamed protein product [Meloidogyne enterolobii]|uniref:Uncharacterized protein n=1 Tax=Meloidogyne enterolobii TaxID=390850 RepID=A0ACB1ARM2_MELEN